MTTIEKLEALKTCGSDSGGCYPYLSYEENQWCFRWANCLTQWSDVLDTQFSVCGLSLESVIDKAYATLITNISASSTKKTTRKRMSGFPTNNKRIATYQGNFKIEHC